MGLLRLLLAAAAILSAAAVAAETRVALVIGNAAYAGLPPLKNPAADAADVAGALERLGFAVTLGTDLDREAMLKAVSDFQRRATEADVALFYYAGHGFQIDALNYLLPVDAAFAGPEDVSRWAIALDQVTSGLDGGRGARLIVLDACRNNPLRGLGDPAAPAARDGLAGVGDAAGFLYVFATQPDNVAYDGAGRNSYFAGALLGHMETPGQDIASTLIDVRKDVLAATGGKQIPWENSSLTREFAFIPGDEGAPLDTLLWQVAATAQDPSLMKVYLDRFPDGAHAVDVTAFLEGGTEASDAASRALVAPDAPGLANALWEVARRLRLRPLVEAYLARAPDGRHAQDARRMLVELPSTGGAVEPPELACERLATHPNDATAATAGVLFAVLKLDPAPALDACRRAVAAEPGMPHYLALLARATAATGDLTAASRLYRDAAERGDVRAMVSLGELHWNGAGLATDPAAAVMWYERAAAVGSPDGAINLAVALMEGKAVPRDVGRAAALLDRAAAAGSARATYNLGVLAEGGVVPGGGREALARYRRSVELGEPEGNFPAAILLDKGDGVPRDAAAAADLLLAGVVSDSGRTERMLLRASVFWSPDTIRAMQGRLAERGLYDGALDGRIGPRFATALNALRTSGLLVGRG